MENTKDTTYNGWKNYETWAVNLHLTNDEGSAEMLREIVETETETRSQRADTLKATVEEFFIPELDLNTYGLASDLLGAALSSVDWLEIIENHEDDNK